VTVNNDQRADHGHNCSQSGNEDEGQRLCSGSAGPSALCSGMKPQLFQGFPGGKLFTPELSGFVVHGCSAREGAAVLGLGPGADNGQCVFNGEVRHGSGEVDFRILNG